MVKRRHKKLSNGFGSITKLKGKNRKKCYWARVTIGFDIRGKPIRKSLGLYLTWEDAYDAIKEYHQKNYNIDLKNATVKDIFDIFFENKKREINPKTKQPISKKTLTRYDGTFKNYFESKDVEIQLVTQLDGKFDLVVLTGFETEFNIKNESKVLNIYPSILPAFKDCNPIKEAFLFGV